MRKYIVIGIVFIVMTFGFFTGKYLYKKKEIKNRKTQIATDKIEDECTYISEMGYEKALISANSKEQKTSPNCTIILKIYYNKCEHLIEKKKTIEKAYVNLTEDELKNKFLDWEVQKFTPTEIVLYKEMNGFCNEHYLLKEEDGYIAIFSLDEKNNETLLKNTDISIKYLEEEDLKRIKEGIYINSKKELNKTIEDFE